MRDVHKLFICNVLQIIQQQMCLLFKFFNIELLEPNLFL